MPLQAHETAQLRNDARELRSIAVRLDDIIRKHPEYLSLQMFDTSPLHIVAYSLEDDADQEDRIREEGDTTT